MKGKYLTMNDAYKIANFDKVNEKCKMLETDNFNLSQDIKKQRKNYEKQLDELKKENQKLRDEINSKNYKQVELELEKGDKCE